MFRCVGWQGVLKPNSFWLFSIGKKINGTPEIHITEKGNS
jgi:hypothetical protein